MEYSVQHQIQEIESKIGELTLQLRPLFRDLLSEEATRFTGTTLTCSTISNMVISYEKNIRVIVFVDESGNEYAKLVENCFNKKDKFEIQECYAVGMTKEDAYDFLMGMKETIDWSYF